MDSESVNNRNTTILKNICKKRFHNGNTFENNTFGLKLLIDKYINDTMNMLEIGSFAGVSSELFAMHVKKIICIDPYSPYPEIDYDSIINAENEFISMMANYDNITKLKVNSKDAVNLFHDGSFDIIYIDGAHDYDNVKFDITSWIPKIKDGGYLSGHDFSLNSVNAAIWDCGLNILEIFQDDSWICRV